MQSSNDSSSSSADNSENESMPPSSPYNDLDPEETKVIYEGIRDYLGVHRKLMVISRMNYKEKNLLLISVEMI